MLSMQWMIIVSSHDVKKAVSEFPILEPFGLETADAGLTVSVEQRFCMFQTGPGAG